MRYNQDRTGPSLSSLCTDVYNTSENDIYKNMVKLRRHSSVIGKHRILPLATSITHVIRNAMTEKNYLFEKL